MTKLFLIISALISNVCFAIQITKSENDVNNYKYLQLDNGIKVVLVSNPNAEKSAAALSVGVGSLNNPKEYQGLAHFLEHMLFLGTKKYPHEGEYQAFINSYGGSTNAYTSTENTVYMFDINPNFFAPALDRFSQFFIAPLFTEDLISREINAIDAEFNLKLNDNDMRDWRMLQVVANPHHPFSRFSVGNKTTLKSSETKSLQKAVIDFYHAKYAPNIMTLALESNQSLAELEKYAKKYFATIKSTKTNDNISQDLEDLASLAFTPEQTGVTVNVQPIGKVEKLMLIFPIPSQTKNYKNKPVEYIANLISSTHTGGLYQILKDKYLINALDAGSFRLTNNQDILCVDFTLSKKGTESVDDITKIFFSYISWLQENGLQAWIYSEAVTAGIREFKFQEIALPLDHVINLANALRLYPVVDLLNNNFLTKASKFSSTEINTMLDKIHPQNMLRIIESPSVETNQTENLYNINYKIAKLSNNYAGQTEDWLLPSQNTYMPINFSIKPVSNIQKFPVEINNNLWFKQDDKFKLPLVQASFILKNDLINANIRNNLRFQLLVKMLNDSLNTELSKLDMAGAAINYSLDNNRFIISINGYSDKIIEVIRLAASNLVQNDFSNNRFESIKQDLQDTLENYKNKKLYDLAYSDAQFVLYPATFHPDLALAALKSINLEEIIHIKNTILSSYIPESFIYGNVPQQEAMGLQYAFFSSIPANKNSNPVNIAKEPYIKLPQDKDYVWFVNPSNTDSNSIVTIYQASQIGYKVRGMAALLAQLIQPEIYSQLRTKEQLGYVVGVAPQRHLDSTGLLFYIESPKAMPNYLLGRLENFLNGYQNTLTNMSQETFDANKRSLVHTLRVRPKTFTTQSTDYFNNIVDGQYEFNSQSDIADILEKTTKEDVLKFYHELLINHLSIRRLISSTSDESFRTSTNKTVITDLKEFQKAAELY